ncbi:MAG: ribonuclease P protein component [Arcobacteraceae bacterium]|nr:ribonuclease P protein component [Arcobacteraceae bacterium]
MSCLNKSHRINNSKEFSRIYRSDKKWHNHSFVAFFQGGQEKLNVAFVTSKKVGNAVKRNEARRRLRAVFLEFESLLKNGKYILVAKDEISNRDYKTLKKDFTWTMKKLDLFLTN